MAYSKSHANRGKKLEMMLDMTHKQYIADRFADVRKVPEPLKAKKVRGVDVDAKLAKAEWVDYSGVYKGKSVAFDAKESTKERWDLRNLTASQYEFLESWNACGSVTFLIVAFWLPNKNEPEIYVLMFKQLQAFWLGRENGESKSIPLKFFREHCIRVKSTGRYAVDYLSSMTKQHKGG